MRKSRINRGGMHHNRTYKSRKKKVFFIVLFICAIILFTYILLRNNDKSNSIFKLILGNSDDESSNIVCPNFSFTSQNGIKISWDTKKDEEVTEYNVMRASIDKKSEWKQISSIKPEDKNSENMHEITDKIAPTTPTQLRYRVDMCKKDDPTHPLRGKEIVASNIIVCLDPGHYNGKTPTKANNSYEYCEGNYTLKIGLELRDILKNKYGISSIMTRDSEHITIDNLTDEKLDSSKIYLRGNMSKGCNLFVSLHTNANKEKANNAPTNNQPKNITKTIVIINKKAQASNTAINIANEIGTNLSKVNYNLKISSTPKFDKISINNAKEWTDTYNDSLDTAGSVCFRNRTSGQDYYDVLRGSTAVNVDGMIIEHGFHTVADMRRIAMENELYKHWAKADASGIASGFGFIEHNN